MNNELDFDLEQLEADHATAQQAQIAYKEAIDDLESAMNSLSSSWDTGSTGISKQFYEYYREKAAVLNDANELMVELIEQLQTKINDFQAAAEATLAAWK